MSPDDDSAGEDSADPTTEKRVEAATPGVDPEDVERLLSVLDIATTSLGADQRESVLSVLEAAIASGSGVDDQTVAEVVSMLAELLVEPESIDEAELEEVLSVVDEVLDGERGDEPVATAFEEGLRTATGFGEVVAAAAEASGFGDFASMATAGPTAESATEADLFRIARIAAAMTRRATTTSTQTGVRTGVRMALAAANEGTPAGLLARARAIALDELGRAGFDVGEENEAWLDDREEQTAGQPADPSDLEERGERLLSASTEVGPAPVAHPAFSSILGQLRPDEARILRLLATEGAQPRVEVHDRGLVPIGARPVAECLTMLGSDAGCRNPEKTPVAVQNLQRLGLVELCDRTVEDLQRYRILEAQSHVEAAHERARWSKSVFGSVRLTDLGVEFCETCYPFEVTADLPGGTRRNDEE